jgi:hypothetical protein
MDRRKSNATARTWALRAVLAILLGVGVGFATGASAVHWLQPPPNTDADTTAVDTTPRKGTRAPTAANANNESAQPDPAPSSVNGTVVPRVVGLQEGDARLAITKAGFTVGTVLFQSSNETAGTVLSSFPVPGEAVPLPATVNLILSDGRPRADSVPNHTDAATPATMRFP